MPFSNALLTSLCQLVYGQTPFTPPTTVYVGLSLTTPGADGSNVTEPAANAGYTRIAISNDTSHFHAAPGQPPTGERQSNTLAIQFPVATLDWGQVVAVVLYDSPSGGFFLGYGLLATPQNIVGGDIFQIAADTLTITMQ